MQFKKLPSAILLLSFLVLLSENLSAQRRDREREKPREIPEERPETIEKEELRGFQSRLWYGGGGNIRFGGFNGFSSFNFGISPMVGYKIIGNLSAGPRVAYDFTSLKQRGYRSLSLNSFDVGAFMRFRVFRGLFLQGELSNQWFQDLDFKGEKFNDQRANQRIGGGWNFGQPGGAGSEISILYNFKVANDINSNFNPVEYRFGFTWKF